MRRGNITREYRVRKGQIMSREKKFTATQQNIKAITKRGRSGEWWQKVRAAKRLKFLWNHAGVGTLGEGGI